MSFPIQPGNDELFLNLTLGCVPQLTVAPSQPQKPVIKAEDEEHSGPTFKPDNAENGLLGRDPSGWGHWATLLRYSPLIWPTKPHGSRLAPWPNDRQRRSRAIEGHSLTRGRRYSQMSDI